MFSRFTSASIMVLLIIMSTLATSHAAKIYRWVDDKGQPHYSENPPRDIQAEALNVRSSGTGSAGSAATSSASSSSKKVKNTIKEPAAESLTSEHSSEDKAKFCQQSRDLMQQMSANTQRRFKQADGSFRKLEQAEIADYRAQAQAGIENYCN